MIKNKMMSIMLAAALLISSIINMNVYADNDFILPTGDDVSISTDSEMTGNIFFGSDSPELKVVYENKSDNAISFTAVYKTFGYDTAMNKQLIDTASRIINVNSNSKYTDIVRPNTDKFGVYTLDVEIKDGLQGAVIQNKEIDFSRSVVGKRNPSLGVNTHFPVYGDINRGLDLISNAGMSMIRDSVRWSEYEQAKGEKNLTSKIKKLINLSADYNIDVLPIIYAKNTIYENSDSAMVTTQEGLSGYSNFVKSLAMTDEFKKYIKAVEICNEPDTAVIEGECDATDKSDAAQKIRAQKYADVLKTAYNSIKSVNPSIKVGAFSTYSVATGASIKFIQEVLSLMDKPYYDAITAHPYFTNDYTDENVYHSNDTKYYLDNVYNPLFTGQFNVSERWYTEFGSTTDKNDTFYVENEYKQAVKNIRAYNTLKKDRFNSKLYLFNFEDSPLTNSSHYGMLNASNADVPYAAKPTYLAVSNLNNLIADATKVESVDNALQSRAFVDKYTCPERDVYMMYARYSGETVDAEYNLGNVAAYYDLYGNKLDSKEILMNGKYHLTENPIYAVCGKDIELIDAEDTSFSICGTTASGEEGKMVSLSVVEDDIGFDAITDKNLVYFDQETTAINGSFLFTVELNPLKSYKAYIVSEDSSVPISFTLSKDTKKNIELSMYAGISKITKADIDVADFNNLKVKVQINQSVEAEKYILFVAVYNEGKLVGLKQANGNTADALSIYDMSGMDIEKYDTVKLMLWDAKDGITPLCDVVKID